MSRPKENYPNFYIFKYHLLKSLKKIINRDTGKDGWDMFDWSLYNLHFRGEIKETGKLFTITLKSKDYVFNDAGLIQADTNIKPLHPLWCLLYETILQLKPDSVLEMGCGSGLHLKNISVIAPDIRLSGFDRSPEQIAFLHELFPDLRANIFVGDATTDSSFPSADIAYTMAVIMHIHKGDTHLTALANLFNSANKQVVMVERWKNHDFMTDILNLQKTGKINWKNILFYARGNEKEHGSRIMVCSKTPLNYEAATSYDIFPKN
ncbi:MAG: class I SAM-dependent methyltransferase [Candidatus Falkowbacteria bacterium]